MLWLTLRQLRNGTVAARKRAAEELYREPNPGALDALATATATDPDAEVRKLATLALGRLQLAGRYEPLLNTLRDNNPEVIKAALFGLRKATDERVIRELVSLLRHQNFSVRTHAAQTIDTIRWVPANLQERVWFQVAKGWYDRAAAAGLEAVDALYLTVQTAPVHAAMRAVASLARIPEDRVVMLLRDALKSSEPVLCIAAADALGKIGGGKAVEGLMNSLKNVHAQIRVAAIHALGDLGAVEAASFICKMLEDKEWDVRQEAAAALGKFHIAETLEPLAKALEDIDPDVRETAAVSLGKIGNRRAIVPLVVALRDQFTAVRRMAAAALSRIDPDWVTLPETREAAEKLKLALQDADPGVRFFVAQMLVNMGELEPEAIAGFSSEDQLASPAIKRKRMATTHFLALLEDPNREIRHAAAEALGRLGGERVRQPLTKSASDSDGDVATAARMALQALDTPTLG